MDGTPSGRPMTRPGTPCGGMARSSSYSPTQSVKSFSDGSVSIKTRDMTDQEKKAETNRLAQAAFRKRRRQRINELEAKVSELTAVANTASKVCLNCLVNQNKLLEALEKVKRLDDTVGMLVKQNELLKSLLPELGLHSDRPMNTVLNNIDSKQVNAAQASPFPKGPGTIVQQLPIAFEYDQYSQFFQANMNEMQPVMMSGSFAHSSAASSVRSSPVPTNTIIQLPSSFQRPNFNSSNMLH
ncbi:hypothetical protein BC830DRAFT_1146331 [Chytriomyces sp. MP71]|nr:hypothetical protein BC830DRAFT_1146331 [Chytriomyces sp. MP71]